MEVSPPAGDENDTAEGDAPVGDSPPRPRWPVAVAAVGWVLWIAFLIAVVAAGRA
jgi:hypothetical protein